MPLKARSVFVYDTHTSSFTNADVRTLLLFPFMYLHVIFSTFHTKGNKFPLRILTVICF